MKEAQIIYPEMGQTTDAEIEYRCSFGSKFYITTDLNLKGRGITLAGDGSNHKRGKKTYHVTQLVMERLKTEYTCCYIASL